MKNTLRGAERRWRSCGCDKVSQHASAVFKRFIAAEQSDNNLLKSITDAPLNLAENFHSNDDKVTRGSRTMVMNKMVGSVK